MNEDELILRRKKQSADRARAYRKRKKDPDAMPSTSTVQSDEPVFENIITTKLLHRKHLNAERCRRYRQKSKRLKSGANFNRGTCDSNTSAVQKVEESCRKCETLRNKLSVRRPVKTYTERARAFRARKEALKNAASQELNIPSSIISNTKPKTPAESSDLTRITVGVELHQEEENSQPSTSTLPMKKIKTSTERGREFGVGEKSLINLTEDIIEDFQTSSNTVNANNNNNNTGNNIELIFVRRSAKTSRQSVRKNRVQKKALNSPASQELTVSSSIISNMDEVIETNNDGKLIMKEETPDVCRACHEPGGSVRHISSCSHLANGLDSGYKIFDDIDIEEHDVLDNPRIKNIFPDITRIKTDVIKYEDEGINDFDEESYETYQQDLTDPEIQECPVVIEDNSLKNNPCFCSDCEILFPTENALNSHKMTAHSFLAAIRSNKAIKSTTKSSIAAKLKFETDSNMEISNLCNHCNKVFPDEISFMKHCDELLTRKFICDECDVEFESEISLQQHLKKHPSILMHCCPICSCSFKFTARIVSHMFNQHQIDLKEEPQRVKTTLKCRFCARILKDNWSHNAHIRFVHRELFNKKCHKFECQPCNLTFLSADSEKIHRISQHAIEAETYAKSIDLDKQIKIEPLSPTISHRVSQHEIKAETSSKSVDQDKQIKIEPLSPTISRRVSQPDIDAETSLKFVNQDKQIKIEPLSPTISHRVTQQAIEAETSSKSVDQDKQIKIEPLSPTISRRVSQHDIDAKTSLKFVNQDKQIKIEPLSPTISHRVTQQAIEAETSSKSVDQDKQIKIEPLSPTITHRVSQPVIKTSDELLTGKLRCKVCYLEFESEISLQQHFNSLSGCLLYCCPICSCIYKYTPRILSHMLDQHQIVLKEEPQRVKTTLKCRFCATIPKDNCAYNAHIRYAHRELFNRKSTKFECQPCNLTFLSADSEKIHRVSQHAIEAETSSKSIDLDKQIKMEPLSPTISHRVSQHAIEAETSSKSVDQDQQIKMEPLSPTISHRVTQHAIEAETSSKSVDLDKQIKMEPLSPTISHRVSQHAIDAETSSKSIDLDKQIKMEPLSPTISHRVSQHAIEAETSSKSVDQDQQIKMEPLSPTISHRVSQHATEAETSSLSVDLDKQIKMEPLSPTISHRVSQPVLKTYSRSVNLDKQIKIKLPSPTIIHRVSQHEIDDETSPKSVDLLIHKQIKIEPLLPKITQTDLKQEL